MSSPALADEEASPVVLQTHLHPPYQVMADRYLSGEVPQTLSCIFKRLDRPYVISLAPRKRSRQLIKDNRIDGFFLSTPDNDLDETSIPTEPLALERWKYYRLHGSGMSPVPAGDSRVGAVLGSNEAVWLKQNNIPMIESIPDLESLVKVLQSQRLSYALVDERAFEQASQKLNLPEKILGSSFVRYVPLMAYFSKAFVKENPGFMEAFNASLNSCVTGLRETKKEEKEHLLTLSIGFVETYQDVMRAEIAKAEKSEMAVMQRHKEDKLWTEAMLNNQSTPLIAKTLKNALSSVLQKDEGMVQGVTEIFVMDRTGFIVGMNHPTSDYWQGDEVAFQQVMGQGKDYYISKIQFDHSTRRFQIQVTLPLKEQKTDRPVGAVTIGYDADRAFQF